MRSQGVTQALHYHLIRLVNVKTTDFTPQKSFHSSVSKTFQVERGNDCKYICTCRLTNKGMD